jgi:hypothetical protein
MICIRMNDFYFEYFFHCLIISDHRKSVVDVTCHLLITLFLLISKVSLTNIEMRSVLLISIHTGLVCQVSSFTSQANPDWRLRNSDRWILREKLVENSESNSNSKLVPIKTDANVGVLEAVKDVAAASLEFLSMVRWGAANALTASLPNDQREELLNRMVTQKSSGVATPSSPREAWMVGRGSIQEEIAVTLAEESRLLDGNWETEADEMSKKIEDAAKARIESEFLVQKNRLEEDANKLIKDIEAEEKPIEDLEGHDHVEQHLKKTGDQIEVEKEKMTRLEQDIEEIKIRRAAEVPHTDDDEAIERDEVGQANNVHPILGSVISDLGYKQIYLVPSEKLGTIPVWNKNRIYRHKRAQSMAKDKLKSMKLGFPGVVCLHEDTLGKLSILDGQHRVGMLAALREERKKQAKATNTPIPDHEIAMFDNVLVEVYRQDPQTSVSVSEHAQAVFLEINKSEPVKLVDLPGVAPTIDGAVITKAVDLLRNQYPEMFSPSQKCYVPNVNEDNFRNNIFGANILNRHKLKSSKELLDWLVVKNAALGEKYENNEKNRMLISKRAWKKTSANRFYLGLESSWLYK